MTAPNEALRTILPIAGWVDAQAADVMFTGGTDLVLPTPFHLGAAGAATLAARELGMPGSAPIYCTSFIYSLAVFTISGEVA